MFKVKHTFPPKYRLYTRGRTSAAIRSDSFLLRGKDAPLCMNNSAESYENINESCGNGLLMLPRAAWLSGS